IPDGFCFRIESSFPGLLFVYALADERREHRQMQEEPVDQIGRKTQRFPEIDEQDHACVGSIVPGLVLVSVIENDKLTLPPAIDLVVDAYAEPLARFGHDQHKAQPTDAAGATTMRGQMLARFADRDER